MSYFYELNLQLFADGAEGAEGGSLGEGISVDATQNEGREAESVADVRYGKQPSQDDSGTETINTDEADKPEEEKKSFADLIKGEYKEDFDKHVQKILKGRLKGSKENEAKLNALSPALNMLAEKYGVDASNAEAVAEAILKDESFYEDEAIDKGMDVETLMDIKQMQRENERYRQSERERQEEEKIQRSWQAILDQIPAVKNIYPSFDLDTEMQNEQFAQLLANNVPLQNAYEVIHLNEMQAKAAKVVADTTARKVANSVKANSRRPSENGISKSSNQVQYKSDPSQYTSEDIAEIMRRVENGEKISL